MAKLLLIAAIQMLLVAFKVSELINWEWCYILIPTTVLVLTVAITYLLVAVVVVIDRIKRYGGMR